MLSCFTPCPMWIHSFDHCCSGLTPHRCRPTAKNIFLSDPKRLKKNTLLVIRFTSGLESKSVSNAKYCLQTFRIPPSSLITVPSRISVNLSTVCQRTATETPPVESFRRSPSLSWYNLYELNGIVGHERLIFICKNGEPKPLASKLTGYIDHLFDETNEKLLG